MDGSMAIPATTSTTLFNGAVPPNGFMVQYEGGNAYWVNDSGPAVLPTGPSGAGAAGFNMGSLFTTPDGYKPMGPINVICGGSNYVVARGW
jgi:hypothetical protein